MKRILIVGLLSAVSWAQNVPAPDIAGNSIRMNEQNNAAANRHAPEVAAQPVITDACSGSSDAESVHQCTLRETAKLFLAAGQQEAALRILCATMPAQEAFRPGGPLAEGKWPHNVEAVHACLAAVGLTEIPIQPKH